MDLYRELILDHYNSPRNAVRLAKPDVTVTVLNEYCGDKIILDLEIERKNNQIVIQKVGYESKGCAISTASMSLLSDKIQSKNHEAVMKLKKNDIIHMIGTDLTPTRLKCALLALEAVHTAVKKLL